MVAVREATDADANAVRETAGAALTLDAAEAPALVDQLWSAPVERERVALVAESGAGVVFASTRVVRPDNSPPSGNGSPGSGNSGVPGYVDLLAVHPESQGRGVGRALVAAAEGWLAAYGVTEVRFAGHPPCYAWPGIDVRYTPALCLVERLGYERYEMAWNMTADLSTDLSTTSDIERLAGKGVEVRSAPASERHIVVEFARRHWNDNWAWEVEHASGCHYAVRAGEVLGFAAWGARPTWFGPMGSGAGGAGTGHRPCAAPALLDRAARCWSHPGADRVGGTPPVLLPRGRRSRGSGVRPVSTAA